MTTNHHHPAKVDRRPAALYYAHGSIAEARTAMGSYLHVNPDPRHLTTAIQALENAARLITEHAPITLVIPTTPAGSPVRAEAEGAE